MDGGAECAENQQKQPVSEGIQPVQSGLPCVRMSTEWLHALVLHVARVKEMYFFEIHRPNIYEWQKTFCFGIGAIPESDKFGRYAARMKLDHWLFTHRFL